MEVEKFFKKNQTPAAERIVTQNCGEAIRHVAGERLQPYKTKSFLSQFTGT